MIPKLEQSGMKSTLHIVVIQYVGYYIKVPCSFMPNGHIADIKYFVVF